jgi:hypothetical protein
VARNRRGRSKIKFVGGAKEKYLKLEEHIRQTELGEHSMETVPIDEAESEGDAIEQHYNCKREFSEDETQEDSFEYGQGTAVKWAKKSVSPEDACTDEAVAEPIKKEDKVDCSNRCTCNVAKMEEEASKILCTTFYSQEKQEVFEESRQKANTVESVVECAFHVGQTMKVKVCLCKAAKRVVIVLSNGTNTVVMNSRLFLNYCLQPMQAAFLGRCRVNAVDTYPVLQFVGGTVQAEFYRNRDSRWAVLRQLVLGAYVGDAIHISGATWTSLMDIIPLLRGIDGEYQKMIIRGIFDD